MGHLQRLDAYAESSAIGICKSRCPCMNALSGAAVSFQYEQGIRAAVIVCQHVFPHASFSQVAWSGLAVQGHGCHQHLPVQAGSLAQMGRLWSSRRLAAQT